MVKAARAWQRMLSGRRLDLIDPSPMDVEIADIAHGLARVARWNGQTEGPEIFSVAQHSLLVEAIYAAGPEVSPKAKLAALLHDAPEYVIGDMISPFKAVVGGEYKLVERRLLSAILLRFGLNAHLHEELVEGIKAADREAAYHEATRLAGFGAAEARRLFGAPKVALDSLGDFFEPLRPDEVERRFLERFGELDVALTKGS